MEKVSAHARGVGGGGDGIVDLSSSSSSKKPENKKDKPLKDTKNAEGSSSRPRFWTRSSSSRLNQPIEGEGLDLEAERRVHEAHEKRQTVPAASAPCSPGAGVAAAMAKLGRESLSMSD